MELSALITEQQNPHTERIDEVDTLEMLRIINNEDKSVPFAVEKELPKISMAVDVIFDRLSKGGRLIYIGAGTSGRLGVLDASECPPTYGVSPETVIGIIAGGDEAIRSAVEGAEDSSEMGKNALIEKGFCEKDVLCGIAASGRTPFVIGGMNYAKSIGAPVISVTCNPSSQMASIADISIAPKVGAEVVTGSTRMKSGTAQKLVLNMLTTGAMIKLGKVYGNLMVDVQPTNEKLINRAKNIVMQVTGEKEDKVTKALDECEFHPKTAIVMLKKGVSAKKADALLYKNGGRIKAALSDE